MTAKPTIYSGEDGPGPLGSTGSVYIEKDPIGHGIIKTTEKPQHGGAGFATVGSIATEKEKTQHGIIKMEEKAHHQGAGFATVGSNFIEKEPTAHGIIKTQEKAEHQGAGFATIGSIHVDKEPTSHGIVRSEEKAHHQGAAFATMGSIATEKEKTGHGIVRSEDKAHHQGAGFATMGSIATDKEVVSHGIITAGAKIKEGPADASTTGMEEHIRARAEAKFDTVKAARAKKWLEECLGETFTEETLAESLKTGVRLCTALNKVYPSTITKINTKDTVYFQRENIANYVKACARLGFNKSNIFDVADLYDEKNMSKVVENIFELAHFGSKKAGLPPLDEAGVGSTS